MSERMTINYDKKPCYDILFTASFEDLPEESPIESSEETILPTPSEMGIDFTDSNAPEFQ